MSPFRLFGPPPEPEPAHPPGDDTGVTWAPGPWAGDPAPATRHARPVGLGSRPAPTGPFGSPPPDDDPPTDPFGFPPIPASPLPASPLPESLLPESLLPESGTPGRWSPAPVQPPPDPGEVAALAGAFAADYLSWDEDDPGRRGRVLAGHLAAPAGDPALLGWDGTGRQRAEFALPGAIRADDDGRLLVDVRVRVTPYRAVGDRPAGEPVPDPVVPGVPACAPAPVEAGWHACASYWVRLIVPVVREDGRLVVDALDEDVPGPGRAGPRPATPVAEEPPAPGPERSPVTRIPELEPEGAW